MRDLASEKLQRGRHEDPHCGGLWSGDGKYSVFFTNHIYAVCADLYIGLPKMFLYHRIRCGESSGEGGVRSHGIPTSIIYHYEAGATNKGWFVRSCNSKLKDIGSWSSQDSRSLRWLHGQSWLQSGRGAEAKTCGKILSLFSHFLFCWSGDPYRMSE